MGMNFFYGDGYGIVKPVPTPPRCHSYLAAMVRNLADLQKKPIPSTLCGICASTNLPTEAYSMLKEIGTLDSE